MIAPITHTQTITNKMQWENTDSSGSSYGMNELLEDITKNLKKQIVDTSSITSTDQVARNAVLTAIINRFKNAPELESTRKEWLQDWNDAFQKNPSVNLSDKISAYMELMFKSKTSGTPGAGGWGDETDLDFFINKAKTDITSFMDKLKSNIPDFIDENLIHKNIDDEITKTLDIFNLEIKDKTYYSSISNFLELKQRALDSIKSIFVNSQRLDSKRPYRKIDQTVLNKQVLDNFRKSFQDKSIVGSYLNDLAVSSFDKAMNEPSGLKDIVHSIGSSTIIDERMLKVLINYQTKNAGAVPLEILDKFLGKSSNPLKAWIAKWGKLISFGLTSKINSYGQVSFTFNAELRTGIIAIPKTTTSPEIKTTTIQGKYSEHIVSDEMVLLSKKYSTTDFEEDFENLLKFGNNIPVIDEDIYDSLLTKYGKNIGDTLTGLTIDDLEKLIPSVFDKTGASLHEKLDLLKKKYSYASSLELTFDIEYDSINKLAKIKPTFKDPGIAKLPTFPWNGTTDKATQNIFDDLFRKYDAQFETIKPNSWDTISLKVVSPLEAATSALYSIFSNVHQDLGNLPYKIDFPSNLKVGTDITIDNLENIYKNLNFLYDKFMKDTGNRFMVSFKVKSISKSEMTIEYEVFDTHSKKIANELNDGNNTKLDNIVIKFSLATNKAEKYLEELKNSDIHKDPKYNDKTFLATFKTGDHQLSIQELRDTFPSLRGITMLARMDGVTLTPTANLIWDSGEKLLYQEFVATFEQTKTDGTKSIITEKMRIAISSKFIEQHEVDQALADIDEQVENFGKSVGGMEIDSDAANGLIATVASQIDTMESSIKNNPNMTKEQLDKILGNTEKILGDAMNQALSLKRNKILEDLKKQFPGGVVPPEIQKLFNEHFDQFDDIIKNNPDLLKHVGDLKTFLNTLNNFDASTILSYKKNMEKGTKVALASLGGILGLGSLIGGANAVKVITTNKKLSTTNNGKIKSSKKLAIISTIIALLSASGSIGTFIYLFFAQGGI